MLEPDRHQPKERREAKRQRVADIHAALDEAGPRGTQCVFEVGIYRCGDPIAPEHRQAVVRLVLDACTKPAGPACLCCGRRFALNDPPEVVAILHAHRPQFRRAIGNAICTACARRSFAELQAMVVRHYREALMPDARVLDIPPQSGRA